VELLHLETITFSDAKLSDINVVLCYILSQYRRNFGQRQRMTSHEKSDLYVLLNCRYFIIMTFNSVDGVTIYAF